MKKKGIIVATIVMVLVLAVSLTTATYAWFTSTATAEIDNLAIQTTAAEGIQIAVYEGTKYYNGALAYDENSATEKWANSEAEGFGTLLDFADVQIGTMNNAVTNKAFSGTKNNNAKFYYTPVATAPTTATDAASLYFVYTADGSIKKGSEIVTNDEDLANFGSTVGTWCTQTAIEEDGDFFRPTGYDTTTQPYGYYQVSANTSGTGWTSYYELPLAMQTVKNTKAIVCSIKIAPTAVASEALYPGMAAATRVVITPETYDSESGEWTAGTPYTSFEPFNAYTYNAGTMTKSNDASKNSDGVFNFIVANGNVTSQDVFRLKVEIWVEGTDGECDTVLMSATDFTVDFVFDVYDATGYTNGDITIESVVYKEISGLTQEKPQAQA